MRRAWMVTAAALLAAACADVGVFYDGTGGGEGGDIGSSSSPSASSSDASSGAGGNAGAGPSSSSVSSGSGGNGGDGAGGAGPAALLDCGNEACPVEPDSACCYDAYQAYGPPQATCVKGAIANDGCQTLHDNAGIETLIQCQKPSQCGAGQTCCADRQTVVVNNQQITLYVETSCQASCNFPDIVLCNDLSSSASCPMLPLQGGGSVQGVCQQSQLLPQGYYVCGYP